MQLHLSCFIILQTQVGYSSGNAADANVHAYTYSSVAVCMMHPNSNVEITIILFSPIPFLEEVQVLIFRYFPVPSTI